MLLVLAAAAAVAAPSPHVLALAAGYKAAFLCSNVFTAGRTEAQATADDLTGIYPDYEPLVGGLPAVIDREHRTVSVAFDAKLPPRVAAWRPALGCAQLPIGADPAAVTSLPGLALPQTDLAATDARDWPLGDVHATKGIRFRVAQPLDKIAAAAFDHESYGRGSETTAVIVLLDGKIVAERYRPDFDMHTPQRTWSVAKSLTATLIGRAAALGLLDVRAPNAVVDWHSAKGDPRAGITYEQLLRMNSGLWTNGPGNRTDELYVGGATVAQTSATMSLETSPGSRFRYANNDILLAAYGLETITIGHALEFPFVELLRPLGMTRTTPETDWQGHYVLSSQVWMTARDLARLALLYQGDGIVAATLPLPPGWGADAPAGPRDDRVTGGTRLLPGGWVKFVSTPAGAQPDTAATGGRGYGAGFWLHGPGEGVPAGTYAMEGNRGQYAVIVPSAKMIVIRRGFDAPGAPFDAMKFTAAVLAAVKPGR